MSSSFNTAKNLCSMVKNRFPYTSPWELRHIEIKQLRTEFNNGKDSYLKEKISSDLQKLRDEYEQKIAFNKFINATCLKYADRPVEYYKYLMTNIDFFKTLWCGATAKLMYMMCRMNGFAEENVERAFVTLNDGKANLGKEIYGDAFVPKRLDHTVNVIKTLNGIAEADALLSKVYKEGEMHKALEKEFREALNVPEHAQIEIYSESRYPVKYHDMPHLSSRDAENLTKQYRELII